MPPNSAQGARAARTCAAVGVNYCKIHLYFYFPLSSNSSPKMASKRICVFCYGSNGVEQVRERCMNEAIKSEAARLVGWCRVFAGKSRKWDDGGVASIMRVGGVGSDGGARTGAVTFSASATASATGTDIESTIFGSVVWLSQAELELLDEHEGCYEARSRDPSLNRYYRARVEIDLGTEEGSGERTEGEVYVRTSHEWECVLAILAVSFSNRCSVHD